MQSSGLVIIPLSTLQSSKLAVICPACLIYSAKHCCLHNNVAPAPYLSNICKLPMYYSLKYMWYIYKGYRHATHTHARTYTLFNPWAYLFYVNYFICSDMQALTFKSDQLLLGFPDIYAKPFFDFCLITVSKLGRRIMCDSLSFWH